MVRATLLSLGLLAGFTASSLQAQDNFLGKSANDWSKQLKDSKDAKQRRSAAFALGAVSFSGGGAVVTNTITDDVAAFLTNGASVNAGNLVQVTAVDGETIDSKVGVGSLAIGTGIGASVGISTNTNTITPTVKAYLDGAAHVANAVKPSPHRATRSPFVRASRSVSHPPTTFAMPAKRNGRLDNRPPFTWEKPRTCVRYVGSHVK